jgi:hypothetical protein
MTRKLSGPCPERPLTQYMFCACAEIARHAAKTNAVRREAACLVIIMSLPEFLCGLFAEYALLFTKEFNYPVLVFHILLAN